MIDFWETKVNHYQYTLKELEKKLSFSHIPSIIFPNQKLKKTLLRKGRYEFEQGSIDKEYISNGKAFERLILDGFIVPSSVRFIDSHVGYGLFAEEDIPENHFIGEYAGIVRENNDHTRISNYLYRYPLLDEIGRNYVIDAQTGSLIRFINHSFHPNLRPTYAFIEGFFHMILLSIYPIKKGTQLTYDYGKKYWYVRSQPKELINTHH